MREVAFARKMGQGLPRAVRGEFARRADCLVCVDGDSEADYADVVRATDLARRTQGKVLRLGKPRS